MIDATLKKQEPEYPMLMESTNNFLLVLFEQSKVGTVVGGTLHPLAQSRRDWTMEYFTPYTGTVTLKNK